MSDDLDYDGAFVMDELTDADAAPGSPNPQEYDEEFGPGIGRDIYALAAARGCEAVLPEDGEIQLDLDTDADYALMELQLLRYNEYHGQFHQPKIEIKEEWRSRSGTGRHVVLIVPMWMIENDTDRVMLQLLFGSDRKREMYNVLRIMKEMPNPVTLFRPLPAGETEATVEVPRKDPIFDAPF